MELDVSEVKPYKKLDIKEIKPNVENVDFCVSDILITDEEKSFLSKDISRMRMLELTNWQEDLEGNWKG